MTESLLAGLVFTVHYACGS